MKVILDTNIIIRRKYRLDGPHVAILERAIALGEVELVVPKIAVEETKNKYRETLLKTQQEASDRVANLNGLLSADKQVTLNPIDVNATVMEFSTGFDVRLEELNTTCPEYADIPQADIVSRDLARRRPFRENGRGYRDALLWETVLRKVAVNNSPAFLVTQNIKDFCADDESAALHLHLVADLEARGLPRDAVKICASIEDIVDKHLKPLLPTNDQVLQQIKNGEYNLFSFRDFLGQHREGIGHQICDQLGRVGIHDWPTELLEDPHVAYVEDPSSVDIVEAYELDKSRLFLAYDITSDVNLDLFVYKSDFYWISEQVELGIEDADWNDHYIWASKVVALPFRLSLALKLGAPDEVESFEVELREFYGWCWQCGAPVRNDAAETCSGCHADLLARMRRRARRHAESQR